MRQGVLSLSLWAALLLIWAWPVPAQEAGRSHRQTIIGQVVSTHCFFQDKLGGVHPQCIKACLKAGQDLAIHDDTSQIVYFLVSEKPGRDPNKPLQYYVGRTVKVTGRIVKRGNAYGLIIKEVKGR